MKEISTSTRSLSLWGPKLKKVGPGKLFQKSVQKKPELAVRPENWSELDVKNGRKSTVRVHSRQRTLFA